MLSQANVSLSDVIAFFTARNISAGYLVPTQNGLNKCILDAHGSLRKFFEHHGVHNYDAQGKGRLAGVVLNVSLYKDGDWERRDIHFYRPETKSGDPRLRIERLANYAKAGDLLVFMDSIDGLHVINASVPEAFAMADVADSPLDLVLRCAAEGRNALVVKELLEKLRVIAARGYVPAVKAGATGVGMTLEAELGIAPNSRAEPDYKGIELKSSRLNKSGRKRMTLFSRAPDWTLSSVGNAVALVEKCGYWRKGVQRLYCTVSNQTNPQGLRLTVVGDELRVLHSSAHGDEVVLTWSLQVIKKCLWEKHKETFWVDAIKADVDGREAFLFNRVLHTKAPITSNFSALVELGLIQLDLTIKLVEGEFGRSAKDHGYLFKLGKAHLDRLFTKGTEYVLR